MSDVAIYQARAAFSVAEETAVLIRVGSLLRTFGVLRRNFIFLDRSIREFEPSPDAIESYLNLAQEIELLGELNGKSGIFFYDFLCGVFFGPRLRRSKVNIEKTYQASVLMLKPNAATIEAIHEIETNKNLPTYRTMEEVFAEMDREDARP